MSICDCLLGKVAVYLCYSLGMLHPSFHRLSGPRHLASTHILLLTTLTEFMTSVWLPQGGKSDVKCFRFSFLSFFGYNLFKISVTLSLQMWWICTFALWFVVRKKCVCVYVCVFVTSVNVASWWCLSVCVIFM